MISQQCKLQEAANSQKVDDKWKSFIIMPDILKMSGFFMRVVGKK